VSILSAELKVRLEPELKAELEAAAALEDRPAGALARRLIREGLEREAATAREPLNDRARPATA
jgi:predicted transcriptional regulator